MNIKKLIYKYVKNHYLSIIFIAIIFICGVIYGINNFDTNINKLFTTINSPLDNYLMLKFDYYVFSKQILFYCIIIIFIYLISFWLLGFFINGFLIFIYGIQYSIIYLNLVDSYSNVTMFLILIIFLLEMFYMLIIFIVSIESSISIVLSCFFNEKSLSFSKLFNYSLNQLIYSLLLMIIIIFFKHLIFSNFLKIVIDSF